jgi:hypothetical protein
MRSSGPLYFQERDPLFVSSGPFSFYPDFYGHFRFLLLPIQSAAANITAGAKALGRILKTNCPGQKHMGYSNSPVCFST